jgi:hypothetical protein
MSLLLNQAMKEARMVSCRREVKTAAELMGPGKNAMSGGGEGTGKKKKSSSQRQVKMVRLMTTAPSGTMEEAKNRGSVHDATV